VVGKGKIFTSPKFRNHIIKSPLRSTKMSSQDISSYVTHLPAFKVVICRFCKDCIPPNAPLRHYESNHTATKAHYVPTEIRHKIKDYMATLDLCDPGKIISPNRLIPELQIVEKGFVCNFPDCGACRTSEPGMRTHYYSHQKSIPKDFENWKETSLQTFFNGQNKK
jgi:hypothetical protein